VQSVASVETPPEGGYPATQNDRLQDELFAEAQLQPIEPIEFV
jgi:hypothetical protein